MSPSLRNLEINFESIFNQYQPPPAVISAEFSEGSTIEMNLVSDEKIYAVIRDGRGLILKSRKDARNTKLPNVAIMPQVAPLQKEEPILSPEYIKRSASSSLSPLHFRNQLAVYSDLFHKFSELVEETWPGVRILELIDGTGMSEERLYLHVRNEDFVAEIGAMGHGLQMWLQTMWFLTRSQNATTVILDEPDVYMHADLQRRIIRFLRSRFPQVIITTHSVEIMSEVFPEEILVIDRKSASSQFASSLPAVQSLIQNIGSVHNIHLTRLAHTRRFIMVEGKDIKLLKEFQNKLFPESDISIDEIPNMPIGGWGGWNYAVGSTMALQNATGEQITTYCILDSDYHTDKSIDNRIKEAKKRGIQLHIWSMKEIENYVIIPTTIRRYIAKRLPRRITSPTVEAIKGKIDDFSLEMEDSVFDAISAELLAENHSLGSGGANKEARKKLSQRKMGNGGLLSIVSEKSILSRLSNWSQNEFDIEFNALRLAKEMTIEEIPREIKEVIIAIEGNKLIY